MWVLLAFFASDNIMGYLASPILFYPLILIAAFAVVAQQMGILEILLNIGYPMVKQQVNGILAKTPIPIRI